MSDTNSRITVSPELIEEIRELLEDAVQYICDAEFKTGSPVAGETIYKIIECLAVAKQAEMQGLCVPDD